MCTHSQASRAPQRLPEVKAGLCAVRHSASALAVSPVLEAGEGVGYIAQVSLFLKGQRGTYSGLKSRCSRDSDAHQISSYLPRHHVAERGPGLLLTNVI